MVLAARPLGAVCLHVEVLVASKPKGHDRPLPLYVAIARRSLQASIAAWLHPIHRRNERRIRTIMVVLSVAGTSRPLLVNEVQHFGLFSRNFALAYASTDVWSTLQASCFPIAHCLEMSPAERC
nr:hypothetical protein CFP56_01453 [Quercus suber]